VAAGISRKRRGTILLRMEGRKDFDKKKEGLDMPHEEKRQKEGSKPKEEV